MSKIKRARIAWKTLVSRLSGLSAFGFSVSWKASEPERHVVRSVIKVLEDKRVLYVDYESEVRLEVNQSLLEIRRVLTDGISRVSDSSPAAKAFGIMRAACRDFLTQPHSDPYLGKTLGLYEVPPPGSRGETRFTPVTTSEDNFFIALGKLRGVFGHQLALLGYLYRIDLEKDLASILPPAPRSGD
jgi:uncharacterized protein DUF6650